MQEVTAWQNRPLEPCYPVVFMDAIRVNIRSDGAVSNKAVFVALAILPDGTRDVPGLWFQANEGARAQNSAQSPHDAVTPPAAGRLERAIDAVMPRIRITELLWEVNAQTGFLDAFTDLRSGKQHDEVSGESVRLGTGFRLLTILERGDRLGDVLLHILQLAECQCLEIEISRWCGPCPGFPGIYIPS